MSDLNLSLAGWVRYHAADGVIFLSPEGAQGGIIRVREGVPLRPFRALVAELIQLGGEDYRDTVIEPLSKFTTCEGEAAGSVTLRVRSAGGEDVERTVALIAGDRTGVMIDAAIARPELFEWFRGVARRLAATWYVGLGYERQRRYLYTPPRGWSALGRPHAVRYLHPDFPVDVSITVHDAWPQKASAEMLMNRSLVLDSVDERGAAAPPEPIEIAPGLGGHLTTYEKKLGDLNVQVTRAVIADDRFVYCAQLDAPAARAGSAGETFLALLRSIEPIPRPQPQQAAPSSSHWVD